MLSARRRRDGGSHKSAAADLQRILDMTEALRSNGRKAKAVFACAAQGFWREFDLPARLPKTNLILNQRFHLKPLAAIFDGMQHACVALVDRTKARVFEITDGIIVEKLDFINELTRRGRSDGWGGYDAGHVERRVANETMQHFKVVSDAITGHFQGGGCEKLLIGCHDDIWSEFEPQLHTYVAATPGRSLPHRPQDRHRTRSVRVWRSICCSTTTKSASRR